MATAVATPLSGRDRPLVRSRRDLLWVIALCALAALAVVHDTRRLYVGITHNADGADYASIARNLVAGRGLTSDLIYPLSLVLPAGRQLPQPLLHRPPGFSFFLALIFELAGATAGAGVIAQGIIFVLTVPLVYVFVLEMFGSPWSARLACVFFAVNASLHESIAYLDSELLLTTLFTLALVMLLKRRSGVWAAASGAALGLCYLVKYTPLMAVPFFMVIAARSPWPRSSGGSGPAPAGDAGDARSSAPARFAWSAAALLFAGWVVAAGPWLVRNSRLTGDPFFAVQNFAEFAKGTAVSPGYDVYRSLTPYSLKTMLTNHPDQMLAKIAGGLRVYPRRYTLVGLPLAFFAIGGWLMAVRARDSSQSAPVGLRSSARTGHYAWALAGMLAVTMAFHSLTSTQERYFQPFVPFIAGCAAVAIVTTTCWARDRFGPRAGAGIGATLVAVALAPPLVHAARLPDAFDVVARREVSEIFPYLASVTSRADVLAAEEPASVAWYTQRFTVWLPEDLTAFQAVEAVHPIDVLYLKHGMASGYTRAYPPDRLRPFLSEHYELLRRYPEGELVLRRRAPEP